MVLGTVAPESAATGRFEICIIEGDRWGSSGYYPAAVVERDGPKVFGSGTQMYLDHPTESEAYDRPERSVRDLIGVISSTPTWNGDTKKLMAEATFFGPYAQTLHEIAPHVGISINAYAHQEAMEAGGQFGPVTTEFVEAVSVDVVTKAGAGGSIVRAIESARTQFLADRPAREPTKRESESGVEITDKTLSDFTTALTGLTSLLTTEAEAREAERARRAEEEKPDALALAGALAEAKLPRPYQARVIEAVRAGMAADVAVKAAQDELAAVLTESGYVKPTPQAPAAPVKIGAPQGDGAVVSLPNGLTVDISEARVNRAIGKKVAG
jgi:hypothetical protein